MQWGMNERLIDLNTERLQKRLCFTKSQEVTSKKKSCRNLQLVHCRLSKLSCRNILFHVIASDSMTHSHDFPLLVFSTNRA